MSGIFFSKPSESELNDNGFADGQNKIIPNDTELSCAVIDGFVGMEEGQGLQVCIINVVITEKGEFLGQKYKYNAKIYDRDAAKRDLAMTNLGRLDAQAGFPMTNGQLELTTENIQNHWAGKSEATLKMGLFVTNPEKEADGIAREVNFVRGFAYLREKMIKPGEALQAQPKQQAQDFEDEIDF